MNLSDKEGRRSAERPDETDEDFIRALNARLAEKPVSGASPKHPILFTAGSPRSGTTILAQSVCEYFDVGYVSGLAAKFWRAPRTGVTLSRMTFRQREQSGTSYYGRTAAEDIHGFHYFWMDQFKLEGAQDLFSPLASHHVDWPSIAGHLAAMEGAFDRPMVYKGYYPSYFMEEVCTALPTAVFILIERDSLMQGLSIYRARQRVMSDPTLWWSMQPPEYRDLEGRPPFEQIAGQIFGLKRYLEQQINQAGDNIRLVRLCYDDLITHPEEAMAGLAKQITTLVNGALPVRGRILQMRRTSLEDYDPQDVERMEVALNQYRRQGECR